jgi:hypothetical protein
MEENLMDYFNTRPMTQNYGQPHPTYGQPPQMPQIDPQQFRQFAITLNDNSLNGFAQIARQRGISEQDIQEGIRFIKSL